MASLLAHITLSKQSSNHQAEQEKALRILIKLLGKRLAFTSADLDSMSDLVMPQLVESYHPPGWIESTVLSTWLWASPIPIIAVIWEASQRMHDLSVSASQGKKNNRTYFYILGSTKLVPWVSVSLGRNCCHCKKLMQEDPCLILVEKFLALGIHRRVL